LLLLPPLLTAYGLAVELMLSHIGRNNNSFLKISAEFLLALISKWNLSSLESPSPLWAEKPLSFHRTSEKSLFFGLLRLVVILSLAYVTRVAPGPRLSFSHRTIAWLPVTCHPYPTRRLVLVDDELIAPPAQVARSSQQPLPPRRHKINVNALRFCSITPTPATTCSQTPSS
jgi:hypothetical protein